MLNRNAHYLSYQKGASLLESCLVIGCLVLLTFWLLPGLSRVMSRQQTTQLLEKLEQSIQLAKNEAIARKRPILLCGSTDANNCSLKPDWGPYWLVGEAEGGTLPHTAKIKKILRVYSIPPKQQLNFQPLHVGAPYALTIQPDGQTYNNGTFIYSHLSAGKSKKSKLVVNNLVRTYQK